MCAASSAPTIACRTRSASGSAGSNNICRLSQPPQVLDDLQQKLLSPVIPQTVCDDLQFGRLGGVIFTGAHHPDDQHMNTTRVLAIALVILALAALIRGLGLV